MTPTGEWRPRVVVCGTGFGRIYLSALRRPGMPFELAGILARGGQRSRRCAEHYGVPLYSDVDALPSTVDIACVVVNAGINGGPGAELARRLLARGVHVIQEHPLHHDELAACLRQAHLSGVSYHLNTHYVHLDAVRRFIDAARRLIADRPPLFVDALGSFLVLYPLLDTLAQSLGGLRPWSLTAAPAVAGGLRSLDGTIHAVPATIRIQHELDPAERDNGAQVAQRISLTTEDGNLLLANSHGPVLWNPRLHMPVDYADVVDVSGSNASYLDVAASQYLGPTTVPSHRRVIGEDWPAAASRALSELRQAILAEEDPLARGRRHLALCRLTADITAQLGPPRLRHAAAPGTGELPPGRREEMGQAVG